LSTISQFWQELKRRNVVRVVTVYAGAAFVILELVDIIAEPMKLPSWLLPVAIVLLSIGLIIAIILSWIYDIHPEAGMVKTEPAKKSKTNDIPKSSNSWKIASYISFLVIGGLILFNIFSRKIDDRIDESLAKSIAVLPFLNLSGDTDQEYICVGLTDEIINHLFKVRSFDKVVSLSSVLNYRDPERNIPGIADELEVNYILEGSFKRMGDEFKITAQLIDPGNENHIWLQDYNLPYSEVIGIPGEIALKIADHLKTFISGEEAEMIEKKPTENLEAYEFYMLGRYHSRIGLEQNLEAAVRHFQLALEIDPNYALAYAGLSDVYAYYGAYNIQSPPEVWPQAKQLAKKALELDDKIAEAHVSLVIEKMYYEYDWEGVEREFKRSIEINPNNSDAYAWYSLYLSAKEMHNEAINHIKRALEIDPLSSLANRNYFYVLLNAGQIEKALQLVQNELNSNPKNHYWLFREANCYAVMGSYAEAISSVEKQISLMGDDINDEIGFLGYLYGRNGKVEKALHQLEKLDSLSAIGRHVSPLHKAVIYIGLKDEQKAIEYIDQGYEEKSGWFMIFLKVYFVFDPLRDDPNFIDIMERMGL
jgi:TolB-like protein/Tfp pilus assembly protein PilF